ncbi:Methyltransferase small domain - like 2, partial [Theobroma cacao]
PNESVNPRSLGFLYIDWADIYEPAVSLLSRLLLSSVSLSLNPPSFSSTEIPYLTSPDWDIEFQMSSRIAQIRLVSSHPEVYEPCDDSFALVDALLADRKNLLEHKPTLCMEVGCGSGYVITSLMLMLGEEANGAQFIATDINHHAIRVTQETMEAHRVHAELINTDIASGLENRLAGLVDLLVVNPPYVPTPEDEVGREGIASAWAGGENGRSVIDRILLVALKLLSKRGWLYMVTLTANNPSQICRQMRKKGYDSRIIVQRSTEEESLHIIKFWKDFDIEVDAKDVVPNSNAAPAGVVDSVLSQFQRLSFWRSSDVYMFNPCLLIQSGNAA